MFIRSLLITAFAALATADPNSICYSYGVDFVDEGEYFINGQSTDEFTSVSYFKGCNPGAADVLFVDPSDKEFLCTDLPTTPENELQMSTCPVRKNEMGSGHWILLVLGNNGDGQPFAWQRDLYLTVGTQTTTTITPTVTFSITTTPTVLQTSTEVFTEVSTTGPLSTVTLPSGTAKKTKTVIPKPVTTTSAKTLTKTSVSFTKTFSKTTKTVTATCTTPGRPNHPDKPCRYSPTLIHPDALVTPTSLPRLHRMIRKSDRAVDYEWARARIEAAKARRTAEQGDAAPLKKRAPDAPVIFVTHDVPVNATTTITAQATTFVETVMASTTSTSTLPPVTVLSGLVTQTVTLPTPTKTKFKITMATTTKTVTFGATFTKTTTVTPSASVTACKKQGGRFWGDSN